MVIFAQSLYSCLIMLPEQRPHPVALIEVEPAVQYSFVQKGIQTRRTSQYKAKLTLSPRLYVKPLLTSITAIFLDPRCTADISIITSTSD